MPTGYRDEQIMEEFYDQMNAVLKSFKKADIWVISTPKWGKESN